MLFLQGLRKVGQVDVVQLEQAAQSASEWRTENGDGWLRATVRTPKSSARYRPVAGLADQVKHHFGMAPDRYDLIVGRHLLPTCQIAPLKGPPVLVDLDDFKYRYAAGVSLTPALLKERFLKSAAHWYARRQLNRFDAAFFVSPQDQQEHPMARSMVLRNVPWSMPKQRPAPIPGKNLIFVGSLWYRPNAAGVDWFLAKVWPRVLEAEPGASLTLIGAASPAVRARWTAHHQVTAPGFVDDLGAAYANAAVVIAPIHSGGGSNIKVLEALAHGRPCVTTDFSYAALADYLESGRDVLVAHDADAFARNCIAVLQEPQRHESVGAAGFEAARRHFGRDGFVDSVERMARSLLSQPSFAR